MTISTRTKAKPPRSLSATDSLTSGFAVNLRWTPIESGSPRSYFVVYRDGNELVSWLDSASYRDSTASGGIQYDYQVATVLVSETESTPSTPASVTVPGYPVWESAWPITLSAGSTENVSAKASDPLGGALTFSRAGGSAPAEVTVSSGGVVAGNGSAGEYSLILRADNGSLYSDITVPLTLQAGNVAPYFTVYPSISTVISSGGTIQFAAVDPEGIPVVYSLSVTRTGITINPSSGLVTITSEAAGTSGDIVVEASDGSLASSVTCNVIVAESTARNVWWYADLETGVINARTSAHDSAYIKTLDEPQADPTTLVDAYSGIEGGFGPTATNRDVHVVASESVNGVTVTPRRGNYFLRTKIYFDKRYESLNGATATDSLNKARCEFAPPYTPLDTGPAAGKWVFDWDTEVWIGFSVFLPTGWEHETGTKDNRGSNQIFDLLPKPSSTHVIINLFVPNSSESVDHWNLKTFLSSLSTSDSTAIGSWESLGSVVPDLGLWTDFVIRYRANPFSVTTNASTIPGGKAQIYPGNAGICQIWKSEGMVDGNGNRAMVLKKNIVGSPVGLVPQTAYPQLRMSLRQYKYGWHKNNTNVAGPIWVGFDEYRLGRAIADGADFADVAPSGIDQR